MQKNVILFLLVNLVLGLTSCSGTDLFQSATVTSTNTPEPTVTLTPTNTPIPVTPTPEATPTDDNIVIIDFNNDTGDFICGIFAYPIDFSGEAENLVENQIMMTGTTVSVEIEKGEYTFEVWDCQMNSLHNLYGFVVEEDFEWNLSGIPEQYTYEGQQSVVLVNERAWDVCEFYIRPGDSDDWGDNLFHPESDYYLTAGSTLIEPIEPGVFDMKLVYCDGTIASTQEDLEIPEDQNMYWTLTP